MTQVEASHWYLVRTKPGKERWVRDQLSVALPEVFLPFLRARMPRWGKFGWSVVPLFPSYLFARCDLRGGVFAGSMDLREDEFIRQPEENLSWPRCRYAKGTRRDRCLGRANGA